MADTPPRAPHHFHPSILREYDIRGEVGVTLDEADAEAIGWAFATLLRARSGGQRPGVAVGRDGRLSSPALAEALIEGLRAGGADVIDIGLGPTPMLYFACASMGEVPNGIQVTGSHNPPQHNGFKIVAGGAPFFGVDIQRLGEVAAGLGAGARALEGHETVERGHLDRRDILAPYVEALLTGLAGVEPTEGLYAERLSALRIGWDAGNGAAGPALERLVARLPGEHHLLFVEVDGHFPHHHPDPSVEENLAELRHLVAQRRLDFGVAFDGDADRIGVVDGEGRVLWGDQLLALFAPDVLAQRPGATVLADIKTSQGVLDAIAAAGGVAQLCPTGHSVVKSIMKATGAPLAGEMTGHIFFADRWPGFDDALYAAVRLMAAVARGGRSVAALRDDLPLWASTPELRFAVDEAGKFAVVEAIRADLAARGALVDATDGVRVTTGEGWWLLRASNTQAMLVARAEARDAAGLARVVAELDAALAAHGLARG